MKKSKKKGSIKSIVTNPILHTVSRSSVQDIMKERLGVLYANELTYYEFEVTKDDDEPFLVDSAMGWLVKIAGDSVATTPQITQQIIDLATFLFDNGDESVKNVIYVSFLEDMDNLPEEQTKAIHGMMKPHMQKLLEEELKRLNIQW